jgi:hypothetical protein
MLSYRSSKKTTLIIFMTCLDIIQALYYTILMTSEEMKKNVVIEVMKNNEFGIIFMCRAHKSTTHLLLERNSAWHTYNITRQTLFVIKRSRPAALCCCEHGRLSRYCNTLLRLWNFRSLEGSTVPLVPCIAKSSPVCKNKHGWYK